MGRTGGDCEGVGLSDRLFSAEDVGSRSSLFEMLKRAHSVDAEQTVLAPVLPRS